ncbi:MAG TPA: DUF4214 domain-containing protein [Pyrinomonadaceae bacterium]|nr:DUF4214 domain-containing protein [Pyrinomonadaceae bacterium]
MNSRARRISLSLLLCTALLPVPQVSFVVSEAAQDRRGGPPPRRGKPEGSFPNLDTVRNESRVEREPPAPIPSTLRSSKLPSQAWDGRRVGEEGIRRAHARLRRVNPAPPLLDDQFVQNFFSMALLRAPGSTEATFWHDQLRVAYVQGQTSVKLAAVALGKTLFESAEYAARNRDDHSYVYDLYKTFLRREPDAAGWDYWEHLVPVIGRENVRRGFEESTEFAGILASIVQNGSATANAASLITALVEPRNQPGHGLLARDANWSVPLLSLPGRAGLDLGLMLSYSSQVWTSSGPYIHFDEDNGFPSPGFRLGFPTVQRKVFNAQTAKNAFLLIAPAGQRVELRQVGTSNVYEAGDSSYLQLIDNATNLLVRATDGTQLSFVELNNEYSCTQVKDRNGNYISINRNELGRISTIIDTLGRVITFNYDSNANLLSITQAWNGQPSHQWVSFGWGTRTMQSSFSGVAVVGTANGKVLPVITQVALNDTSYFTFDYNNSLQVSAIRNYFGVMERSAVTFTYETPASDVPRLLDSRVSALNWTGINGVPAQVITQYSVAGDGACVLTAPNGIVYKEYYGSGWQKGLTTLSEVWSGVDRQKWTTTAWTQDNTSVGYEMNPRVTETNVYDMGGNRRRTVIDYGPYAQFGLPYGVREFDRDGTTELRQTYTDYNLSPAYLDRRIIGLVSYVHVSNVAQWQSKTSFDYDDAARLQSLPTAATQHDTSYNNTFTARGNVTAVSAWDVSDITNAEKKLTSYTNYFITGTPSLSTNPAGHQHSISYTDSFSDTVNRNTFAYPTTSTDPDSFSSYLQYNYDFGAVTRTQSPTPAGQSQGAIQAMTYNNLGQLERITTGNNGAYKRFWHGPNYTASYASVNNVADELYAIDVVDGLGRTIGAAGSHPGSTGGYGLVVTIYDQMGRAWKVSNPTEVNNSWVPYGDDAAGIYYTQQTYDWNGRPLVTTNPDGTTKEASYSGCGCAGRAVVTLTDEGTIEGGVSKRRQQKIYADVFGRTVKTELLNWQNSNSIYSATVNTYNVRDQITQVRQFAGAEGSGTYQDTTMIYDGYGRLQSRRVPQDNAGTATTWTYNPDDSVNTITDARGAVTTFGYAGTRRGLVKTITHTLSGSPQINVSYNYDAAGNRTSMSDGVGTASYSYDQLSRMTAETRNLSGVGSFGLSYSYNLVGQLASFNSLGHAINYARDATGRLTGVSGSPFGGVTQYVSNIKYRAWGARRELTYGNNHTASTQYNSRLLPTSYSLSNVMTRSYSYFADGRLSTSSLSEDGSFNRAYEYNQAGRLKSDTTPNNFAQELTYDVWGNVTQSVGWHWSRFINSAGTYINNRNTAWQYNAAGQVTSNGDNNFQYDAAGRISKFWKQGLVANGNTMLYDGDGQLVRGANVTLYNLHSTVLGGRVVAEISDTGQRTRGFVYAEGEEVLALQNDGANNVVWEHRDASEQSVRQAESSGAVVDAFEETASGAKIEPVDPYPTDPSFTGADTDGEYPHLGTIGKPITGCAVMGVPLTDCSSIFDRFHPMEFMEWSARSEFFGYSVSTADGPKKFGNNLTRAIGEAYEQGHLTVTANWRINDNWFQGSSLQAQSQNPRNPTNKGTPMTDAEIARHRAAVEELLQDKTCKKFVEGVLARIGDAQRKAFSGDLLKIFDEVTNSNGWGWRKGADMNYDLGEGGSYVGNTSETAYVNISREVRMYGDSSSTGFVGRVAVHELLHVGSSAVGQFTHWDMFRAGYSVAKSLGIKLGVRKPTEKDPGGRDDYNAIGFDDLLFEACQIRKVRSIR